MYADKVLLTIAFCATSAWCGDQASTRNARTIGSSFLARPLELFRTRPDFSIIPNLWPGRSQLQEWARSGANGLLRLASFANVGRMRIEFTPEAGPRAAEAYQRRFGYRGVRLIERLGNGLGPTDVLPRRGRPVPGIFLTPPPISYGGNGGFHRSVITSNYYDT